MGSGKTKLMNEIEGKVQALNLLLSVIKTDRSRKPETIVQFRYQYDQLLQKKSK